MTTAEEIKALCITNDGICQKIQDACDMKDGIPVDRSPRAQKKRAGDPVGDLMNKIFRGEG